VERFAQALESISADRKRGAALLADETQAALEELALGLKWDRPAEDRARLRSAVDEIRRCRPAMASPGCRARRWLAEVERKLDAAPGTGTAADELRRRLSDVSRRIGEQRNAALKGMVDHARELLAGSRRLLTFSRSSTVERLLREALPPEAEVAICESRPAMEGRELAAELADQGRSVTLIGDAQAGIFLQDADFLLLGCDAVIRGTQQGSHVHFPPGMEEGGRSLAQFAPPDLWVVNKAGSLALCLLARHHGVPVHVAAEACKFSADPLCIEALPEEHDPAEIWPELPHLAANPVLEAFPGGLVRGYISARGFLSRRGAGELLEEDARAFAAYLESGS